MVYPRSQYDAEARLQAWSRRKCFVNIAGRCLYRGSRVDEGSVHGFRLAVQLRVKSL